MPAIKLPALPEINQHLPVPETRLGTPDIDSLVLALPDGIGFPISNCHLMHNNHLSPI